MKSAPNHPKEAERLTDLLRYEVLDTESENAFDELTSLASTICGTPISLISLVDDQRQWFKSKVGLDAAETDKSIAFCSHAILEDGIFEVPNALDDERFHDNPLVSGAPDIRFYAGAPLVTPNGNPIGTLCVIDKESKNLNHDQQKALKTLANQVISQLELRLHNRRLTRINQDRENMLAAISHDLKSPFNVILGMSKRLAQRAETLDASMISQVSKNVLNSSMQAYQLLDELLQWSQSRMGAIEVKKSVVDLNVLISSAIEIIESAALAKNVEINNTIAGGITALLDPTLTKVIIRNLVSNAIKYSPENSSIKISAKLNTEHCELSVQDSGDGIDKELSYRLFDSTVESNDGSIGEKGHGLGLRLCAEFIKLQNGKIWVDDQYKDGAKIIISLPMK